MLFWKLSLILRTFGNAPLRIDRTGIRTVLVYPIELHRRAVARFRRNHPDQRHDAADERRRNRLHKDRPAGHGPTTLAPSSTAVANQLATE